MTDFEGGIAERIQNKELAEVVLGRMDLGRVVVDEIERAEVGASILKVEDEKGELFLPGFEENTWSSLPLPQGVELELDERQKDRLGRAIELKLPPLVAVHLALNTDEDLDEYGPLVEDQQPGYVIGVYGEPGQYKSKSIAILREVWGRANDMNVEAVGFDTHSNRGVDSYLTALQNKKRELGRELGPLEMIDAIKQVDASEQATRLSLRETLDNYVKSFKGGRQANIYLVDLPGLGGERKMDEFDVLALYGMVTIVAQKGIDETATLLGYINELQQYGGLMIYELMLTEANRIGVFYHLVSQLVANEVVDF